MNAFHSPDIIARQEARKVRKAEQANYPSNRQYRKDAQARRTVAKLRENKLNSPLQLLNGELVVGTE